ncbi:MAG: ATP-binding protein [Armatimonadetes bacterium CG07_land_8_20_14_0_80_40_9]|nr:MAG: ATP-binding protein [Armatimonadetes bacterium CG07_land_8_20_14_0_80_40_9]
MEDISLHILDIVENSIRAGARRVEIKVFEEKGKDLLTLRIKDDGKGMSKETQKKALDSFFTTKKGKRIGLGLPLLYQSTKEAGGDFMINSKEGEGTKIVATFKLSNIDRKPLGNINETIRVLRASHPKVEFLFEHNLVGVRHTNPKGLGRIKPVSSGVINVAPTFFERRVK